MFRQLPTALLLLLLAPLFRVGVSQAFIVHLHGTGTTVMQRPIITPSQQLRICADLCRSGLGGAPCGDVCYDLLPKEIPVQLPAESADAAAAAASGSGNTGNDGFTRTKACPILCKYKLGFPFCQCDKELLVATTDYNTATTTAENRRSTATNEAIVVDFNEICDHYCSKENWVLRGCPDCRNQMAQQEHLPSLYRQDGGGHLARMVQIPGIAVRSGSNIDWGKWCNIQCANSNGGSACNCDILPFALKL